ncbi:MAG: aminotransferase class III-fold pyridoxal phosphate-dependent enzyme [Fibrobacteria bacterium]|nr:aminotransferase class III-fold pyridoxal phosphate-dependent enzyme [Fibrobacteria bacterium]
MKPLKLHKGLAEFQKAKKIIPGGTLGIRRPYNFVEGEYPIYIDSGKGGHITDIDGNKYIDYLCAYGPIILGYREAEVDEAVIKQIRDKGFCFSLTQTLQNRLAEKLISLIPCAEKCVFVKTGSDATTLAVRIARGYTKKTSVLRCGYHGWHDWCVEVKGGIPEKLYEDIYEFKYNDLEAARTLADTHKKDLAAIIVTPLGHPLAHNIEEPAPGFLEGLKELAKRTDAVLIFDEIRTGFRLAMGGAQEYYGVTPDLACFGKALANGYAISAVCGKEPVMNMVEKDVFVSSTFFPNSDSYAAALKTLEIMERDKVLSHIWKKGNTFLDSLRAIIKKYPLRAEVSGIAPLFFITFARDNKKLYKKRRLEFYTQLIRRGIFMQPYHHSYICYRHSSEDLTKTLKAIDDSLRVVTDTIG